MTLHWISWVLVLSCAVYCFAPSGLTRAQQVDNFDQSWKSVTDELLAAESNRTRNLQVVTTTSSDTCNLTSYTVWSRQKYVGILSSDTTFWIYQTQPQIVLTNGLALQLVVIFCKRQFNHLYLYKAGLSGPITLQDSYKPMCSKYCLQSDILHQAAMTASGCSCLELSTQSTDSSYTAEGDWCSQNSARLLCDLIGYCGVWRCDLSDFMCPRYEWNKKKIPYIGLGSCSSAMKTVKPMLWNVLLVFVLFIFTAWRQMR